MVEHKNDWSRTLWGSANPLFCQNFLKNLMNLMKVQSVGERQSFENTMVPVAVVDLGRGGGLHPTENSRSATEYCFGPVWIHYSNNWNNEAKIKRIIFGNLENVNYYFCLFASGGGGRKPLLREILDPSLPPLQAKTATLVGNVLNATEWVLS